MGKQKRTDIYRKEDFCPVVQERNGRAARPRSFQFSFFLLPGSPCLSGNDRNIGMKENDEGLCCLKDNLPKAAA